MILLLAAASAQDYAFPTTTLHEGFFYPTAYYDQGGVQDWNCGTITYSGHRGSDFGGGGFAGMDAGRDITAAADGVVAVVNDGEFDRCTTGSCAGGGGFGNYVAIDHADGRRTYYAHLKQFSVLVAVGDPVTCGQKLGEMGSSGNSTGPHLHFEVRSGGVAVDPFAGTCSPSTSAWVDQGIYDDTPGITCGAPPVCDNTQVLSCGSSVTQSNGGTGSTDVLGAYACTTFTYSGSERAYRLVPPTSGSVTLDLTGLAADLDLFVMDADGCDAADCLASSTNSNTSDETVTFTATGGSTYTVVVDGWEDATSSYTLAVTCPGGGDADTDADADSDTDADADTDTDADADTDTDADADSDTDADTDADADADTDADADSDTDADTPPVSFDDPGLSRCQSAPVPIPSVWRAFRRR